MPGDGFAWVGAVSVTRLIVGWAPAPEVAADVAAETVYGPSSVVVLVPCTVVPP